MRKADRSKGAKEKERKEQGPRKGALEAAEGPEVSMIKSVCQV